MSRSLSNVGPIDCAGGRAARFANPFRQIVMTLLLKRSKNRPHSPTWLATLAQIRQAPRRLLQPFPSACRAGRDLPLAWLCPLLLAGALLVVSPVPAQMQTPELSHTLTRLAEPAAAPDFVVEDIDGEPHALRDYRGKVVLINFWATWCPPCRREMPSLEALYQKLHAQPFAILAINQWESPDHVFSYMGDLSVFPTFPILFDRNSEVSEAFGVKGLPTSVVVDKQGRVVFRAIGGREFDHPEIERAIRELIEDPGR